MAEPAPESLAALGGLAALAAELAAEAGQRKESQQQESGRQESQQQESGHHEESEQHEEAEGSGHDERIRIVLAGRLAELLPRLTQQTKDATVSHVLRILGALVRDQSARVRAIIAAQIKTMPEAPHDLIYALASDSESLVADPVIVSSPVLTDQDLLTLVNHPPAPTTTLTVARRPHLSEAVCDAIVATNLEAAIAALIANSSAAIREVTLQDLIARSRVVRSWQEPLVGRPRLSDNAMRALVDIVSTKYLALLSVRIDLPADALRSIRARLAANPPKPRYGHMLYTSPYYGKAKTE